MSQYEHAKFIARSHDPAVAQLDDAVSITCVFFRMRHLDDGHAFIIQFLKEFHDLFALARVEIAGRFVGEKKVWIGDDGTRDADQLLLSARQLPRIKIFFSDDVEAIERVSHDAGALRFTEAPIRKRDIEVLVNGQIVEQMVALKNETDLFVAQSRALFRFQMMDGGLAEKIFAVPTVVVHANDVEERRFTRTRGAHHGNKLSFVDFETDIAQDVKEFALGERINAFEIFELNHSELFVTKRLDRIQLHGGTRGQVTGNQSDHQQNDRDEDKAERVM